MTNALQYDYRTTGTFDFQLEPNTQSLYGVGPQNPSTLAPSAYHEYAFQGHCLGGLQTLGSGRLLENVHSPHVLNAPFPGSVQGAVYNYHFPQPRGYLQFTQILQPIPPGHRRVCPTPIHAPSVPILIRPGHVEMVCNKTNACPPATVSYDPKITGNGPSSLHAAGRHNQPFFFSCDHTNCAPPPNVGLLSRRFEENERWKDAREAAVASLAYRRSGSESL